MTILYDKVNQLQDNVTITVYLDPYTTEFANEREGIKNHKPLKQELRHYIRSKYPQLKKFTVKVMIGSILVGSYVSSDLNVSAQAIDTNPSTYTIQSGDTLYSLAREYKTTVDDIKAMNDMDSTILSIGKEIVLPNFYYTVTSGDTLYSIARKYDTTVQEIKSLNNLSNDRLSIGQQILVPNKLVTETTDATSPTEEDVEVAAEEMIVPTINYEDYIVVPGDYLSKIANQFHTTVQKLKELNKLTSDVIYVGQKITIPVTTDTTNHTPNTEPIVEPVETPNPVIEEDTGDMSIVESEQTGVTAHVVTSGETLYSISRQYNVSVDELKTLNNLSSNTIYLGQQINIPITTPIKEADPASEAVVEEPTESIAYDLVDYTVVKGDTLNGIAKKFKTTTNAIKEENQLQTDTIFINQKLTIPVLPGTDYTAPDAPVMTTNSYLSIANDSTLTIQGTTEPEATLTITISDGTTNN